MLSSRCSPAPASRATTSPPSSPRTRCSSALPGDVVPRLEFFISFYGSFEKALVAAKRNGSLLNASLERLIEPNIALFRQWGVRDIVQLCSNVPRVLTFNLERLKESLLRAEQLGVPPTSGLLGHAVSIVSYMSEEKVAAKLEFFKSTLGCSDSEVSMAVSKLPSLLGISDEILLRKIKFLVNEAMMEPRYIVERPVVLSMSLEKRLMPRHYVMKILQEKGLLNSNTSFLTFAKLGEKSFKLKFIDCHKDSIPGLADAYATARTGVLGSVSAREPLVISDCSYIFQISSYEVFMKDLGLPYSTDLGRSYIVIRGCKCTLQKL
ncbi:hypothetical protein BDA96_06G200100 [Sorghum bicolor]|uniref:Uncharacterized protein n=2 Tax=Sorghum bicolor TaxID=4558 RepID=A0A921UDZ7_SORBI|nr:hypothetical protein BDA96_06G200100 [Sorghum bicolor]